MNGQVSTNTGKRKAGYNFVLGGLLLGRGYTA
jgi:hypothetical protein